MIKAVAHVIMLYCLRITLALRSRRAVPPAGSLLVMAPHPDDEMLGLGGCILAALERRQVVNIVYLTDGEAACPRYSAERVKSERAKLTCEVIGQLGIPPQNLHYLHLTDSGISRPNQPGFNDAVERLRRLIDDLKPDNLLATHRDDFWPYDHVACAELAEVALARATHKAPLYEYWVWAWYNLRPWRLLRSWPAGLFSVDIRPWAAKKRALGRVYLDAKSPDGMPWSGVLPWPLRHAFNFNIEVLEKVTANE